MKELFIVHMARIIRHKIFIAGIALAFALTYWFTYNAGGMDLLHNITTDFDYSIMASLGIPAFFSVFTPVFLSAEYKGGTIRNKLICGKTRSAVYFSSFLAITAAMIMMTAAWAAASVLSAQTLPDAGFIAASIVKIVFYNTAYITFLVFVCMMIENEGAVTAIDFMSFQFSLTAVLMMQMMMGAVSEKAGNIIAFIINILPLGQWVSNSAIADESIKVSGLIQLILSVMIIVLLSVYGSGKFRKKDIR